MKRIFLLALLLISGCSEDPGDTAGPPAGKIKVSIDGQPAVSKSVTCTLTQPSDQQLTLTASFDLEGREVRFMLSVLSNNVYKEVSTGEYTIDGIDDGRADAYFYYFPVENETSFTAIKLGEPVAGMVRITALDKDEKFITGTFEVKAAKGEQVVAFTDGTFTRIPYTE